jgi:hypothetical protein
LLAGIHRAWLLKQGGVRERILRTDELSRCSRLYLAYSIQKEREVVMASESKT